MLLGRPGPGFSRALMSSGVLGRPRKKPCPISQPIAPSRESWLSSSIPSATTDSDSAWLTPRIACSSSLARSSSRLQPPLSRAAMKLPVDLEDVHRQPAQLREGRVAGAEVVDRDAHAERS